MSNQFLHLSLYGSAPRRGQPKWATISGIVREGARAPDATRHLRYPAEPRILHGISPIEVGHIASARAAQARDALGRRLRQDGAVLVAAVLSYPVPRDLVEDRDAPDAGDLYAAWRSEAVAWCRQRFGDTLLSVVEHHDEDYPHLHAYAVPDLDPNGRLLLETIHPGRAALKRAQAEGQSKGEQRAAYHAAMGDLQDDFHAAVSHRFGHARLGPRRRRLDRSLYLIQRDARRREVELERAYAEEEVRLRSEIEDEMGRRFAAILTESQRRTEALSRARESDQRQIADLLAECGRLREEVQAFSADRGYGG